MYFVDREKIEQKLVYMEQMIEQLKHQKQWTSSIEKLALERLAHTIIEAVIDVGNAMIDGFIMRDPGSYEDIIDILEDEKVVDSDSSVQLREVVRLRKELVLSYTEVNHENLMAVLQKNINSLQKFPQDVRQYLVNELGPVSAFLPNQNK